MNRLRKSDNNKCSVPKRGIREYRGKWVWHRTYPEQERRLSTEKREIPERREPVKMKSVPDLESVS
ncbi:uncharacterized protein FFB20_11495 [Fusarium fujikuroi]|nr:uncharacterized protein FFE2_00841 [Fusarium fujikuroi]SCN70221.1 uncharacterized protein FFC1_00837 [Fusarium fujikuroi]SCN73957.1 uncharacterized protein FFM5_00799 [Fusarium fujikuroi]SCO01887.1 uncharacterized protein FFB20_11495 [Fusarium fujikuroi]SCO29287.1 uncharacterized protein FFNC_00838 [Fusarium fujikuroi]